MRQNLSQAPQARTVEVPSPQTVQAGLERIPGVLSASVILDHEGVVSEVHLVSSYAKRPKSLVRDAESLLCAQFQLQVDYRCISVVQIPTENDEPLMRRSLRYVSARVVDDDDFVEVELLVDGQRYRGAAPLSGDTEQAHAVAAGQATLLAVQHAYELVVPLTAQEAHIVPSSFCPVCVSVVEARTKHGQELLTGTCFVLHGIHEAGAKAVLDAINRRVTFWVRSQALGAGG